MSLLGIALFLISICNSQTFSKRSDNAVVSVYLHVLNQPYGYQTYGANIDTSGGYQFSMIVKNFDYHGNEMEMKHYNFPNRRLDPNYDVNTRLNDSTSVFVAIDKEIGNDTTFNTVVWLNNEGDTIRTKRYHSPYHDEDDINGTSHFVPTAVAASPDGQFIYFVSQVSPQLNQNNFIIKKIYASGENCGQEVWTYINPVNFWYTVCENIVYYNSQLWFLSVSTGEQNNFNKLIRLNSETGTLDYEVEHDASSYPVGGGRDMVIDSEGYTVTSVIAPPIPIPNDRVPIMFKVDFEGNYIWYQSPSDDYRPFQRSHHIVKSQDGGYVSCSIKFDEIEVSPGVGNYNEKIWLWKVDADGEFEWQRFYEYLSFDSGYFDLTNVAHDMKTTPDGGFIMAGETKSDCADWPECDSLIQQGWLLKVDACGCLVPGCDAECNIVNIEGIAKSEERKKLFIVGPNPVKDMLNVYLPPNLSKTEGGVQLTVHDLQGNLIKSFNLKNYDTTYMINATSLAAGQYILSLVSKGIVIQTERITVIK